MCSLELIGSSIIEYAADRQDKKSAENMMLGSLFAGIAFSHARLGNVHAMSHPVSAFFNVPHGVANAILLPKVVEFNECAVDNPDLWKKYFQIYRCVCKEPVLEEKFLPSMLKGELKAHNAKIKIPGSINEAGITE